MIAKDDQINDQNDSKKNKCFSQFKNGIASFLTTVSNAIRTQVY